MSATVGPAFQTVCCDPHRPAAGDLRVFDLFLQPHTSNWTEVKWESLYSAETMTWLESYLKHITNVCVGRSMLSFHPAEVWVLKTDGESRNTQDVLPWRWGRSSCSSHWRLLGDRRETDLHSRTWTWSHAGRQRDKLCYKLYIIINYLTKHIVINTASCY